MIFGMDYKEQYQTQQARLRALLHARVPEFAWYPRRHNNGRYVWLCRIWVKYHVCDGGNPNGYLFLSSSPPNVFLNPTGDL